MLFKKAAVDPLPLVPAIWILRNLFWGLSSLFSSARTVDRPGLIFSKRARFWRYLSWLFSISRTIALIALDSQFEMRHTGFDETLLRYGSICVGSRGKKGK